MQYACKREKTHAGVASSQYQNKSNIQLQLQESFSSVNPSLHAHIFNLGFVDVALFLHIAFGKHSTSVSHDVLNAGTKSGPGKKLVHTNTYIQLNEKIINQSKNYFNSENNVYHKLSWFNNYGLKLCKT